MDPFSGMMMSGYGQFASYVRQPPAAQVIRPASHPKVVTHTCQHGKDPHGCAICRWESSSSSSSESSVVPSECQFGHGLKGVDGCAMCNMLALRAAAAAAAAAAVAVVAAALRTKHVP